MFNPLASGSLLGEGAGMDMYLWLKAFHLMAVIAWFAGLFYLPRLFVYHTEHPEAAPVLKLMERKLMGVIMRPAALAVLVSGLGLVVMFPDWLQQGWFHAKLALVLGVYGYHGSLEVFLKQLQQDRCGKSGKFFRMYNEIPTVLMVLIVFLVVAKPF